MSHALSAMHASKKLTIEKKKRGLACTCRKVNLQVIQMHAVER